MHLFYDGPKHVAGLVAAVSDVGAKHGKERRGVAEALRLGQGGQGRGLVAVHPSGIEHAVAVREHPRPAVVRAVDPSNTTPLDCSPFRNCASSSAHCRYVAHAAPG